MASLNRTCTETHPAPLPRHDPVNGYVSNAVASYRRASFMVNSNTARATSCLANGRTTQRLPVGVSALSFLNAHVFDGLGDAVLDRADHVVHLKEALPEFQRTLTAQRSEPRVTRNQLHEPAVPFLVPCEDSSIALP